MSSKLLITKSTGSFSDNRKKLFDALQRSDAVVIGAGAGLSAAAGFTYDGERFQRYFSEFEAAYGFHDMYTGGFYPYETPEEYWAYWSRFVTVNRYCDAPTDLYSRLLACVQEKEYFVITTNVDHCFQKTGFDKKRLFYTQGDYGLCQCSGLCCQKTFDNEQTIRAMAERQKNRRVPTELIPVCPFCGRPLTMNLRADDTFVEDEGWHRAAARYTDFLRRYRDANVLFLELGVGYNTPGIIKYPFWQMTVQNPKAVYACVNRFDSFAPEEIRQQSILLNADIDVVFANETS